LPSHFLDTSLLSVCGVSPMGSSLLSMLCDHITCDWYLCALHPSSSSSDAAEAEASGEDVMSLYLVHSFIIRTRLPELRKFCIPRRAERFEVEWSVKCAFLRCSEFSLLVAEYSAWWNEGRLQGSAKEREEFKARAKRYSKSLDVLKKSAKQVLKISLEALKIILGCALFLFTLIFVR
jgi:hypothetical protein